VGNDGEQIVADSSTSTGLRWQGSQAAGKNFVINGDFDIWQRGTSTTTNANYGSADRWWMYYGAGTSTFSRESTIVPTGSTYSLKIAQSVATNTNLQVLQSIESLNAVAMAGKTVTISGLFAASASTTLILDVVYSTATDVTPSGSWTGATVVTSGTGTVSTTASFSRITGVYTIPSTAKSVMARIVSTSVTSGTSVYAAQIQLELGNVPTTFTPAGGTIQGELAACQRYYFRNTAEGTYSIFGFGSAGISTNVQLLMPFPVRMRIAPTTLETGGSFRLYDGNTAPSAVSAINIIASTELSPPTMGGLAITSSGLTQYRPYRLTADNSSTAYIAFSAEL
jgi:hypothetical protein